jgi:exonuclease SbcC
MKFHRIEIQNINSLYGSHTIDLEGRFKGVPLYLIMGPTGSGKTTILDAICLALFGRTPRQLDASGGAAGVGELVNSHGTGESKAEVVFSLLDASKGTRTRYRAVWAFWRSHHKPEGTPQKPRRELHRQDANGEWLELTSSQTEKHYNSEFDDALDGMTLRDFLRSVMLAQGEFAALLSAKAEEKAAILERLTDTGVYRKLGRLAHERWQQERERFARLDEQVKGFEGVSVEQLEAAGGRLDESRRVAEALAACRDAAALRRAWFERRVELGEQAEDAAEKLGSAKKKREERDADFRRLGLDRQARPARDPLRELRRLEDEHRRGSEKLPQLVKALAEAKTEFEKAGRAEAEARDALKAAEDAFELLKPRIQAAKEAQNNRRNALREVEAARTKVEGCEATVRAAQAGVAAAERALNDGRQAKTELAAKLAAISDGAQLAEKLPLLQAEHAALAKASARAERAAENLAKIRADIDAKQSDRDKVDAQIEAQRVRIQPLQKELDAAKNHLEELLEDADKARERRDEIDAQSRLIRGRYEALVELMNVVENHREKRARRAEVFGECEVERAKVLELDGSLVQKGAEKEKVVEERAGVAAEIERLRQNLLAAELRRALHSGQDCPVCGGRDHPKIEEYGTGALSEIEQADQREKERLEGECQKLDARLEKLSEEIKECEAARNKISAEVTAKEARLSVADEELEKLSAEMESLAQNAGFSTALSTLATSDSESEEFEIEFETASKELRDEMKGFDAQKAQLDAAEDAVDKAEKALATAAEGLGLAEQRQREAAQALKFAGEQRESAAAGLEEVNGEVEQIRERLRGLLVEAGVEIRAEAEGDEADGAEDFDAALSRAAARLEAWRKAEEALRRAEKACDELEVSLKQSRLQRENDEAQLKQRQAELDALHARLKECEAQVSERTERLGGKSPERVEAVQEEALKSARGRKEKCGEARQAAEKELQRARSEHDLAEARLGELVEKIAAAGELLDEVVAGIRAENEELATLELIEAALLDDPARGELERLCEGIQLQLRDARREAERVAAALKTHDGNCPADFEAERYTAETLCSAERQLSAAVDAQHKKVGTLENEVSQLRQRLESLQTLLAERDRQKQEFEAWNELNDLIGVKSGERFKQFAQALYLDRIVDRANQRLKELHPRYLLQTRLDPESRLPTLDFEIIDKYRADSRRPLSTLSGGETFLVSLALALALADQQKIKMPMETLFLDEGFGTLDRDSLQKAMEILQHLHARVGRTVAVISHVETLQEEIAHQVVVKPLSGGRSTLELTSNS